MDYEKDLHELCETISHEIADANEKIRAAGGKLSGGDYDTIDKLTHSLKSIKTTIAMMEDEDEGYSSRAYPGGMGGNYRMYPRGGSYNGGSYRGGSYARGRNARRDSMGRYSGDGYSRDEGMAEELRGLMEDAPNDTIKRDLQRIVEKIEQM